MFEGRETNSFSHRFDDSVNKKFILNNQNQLVMHANTTRFIHPMSILMLTVVSMICFSACNTQTTSKGCISKEELAFVQALADYKNAIRESSQPETDFENELKVIEHMIYYSLAQARQFRTLRKLRVVPDIEMPRWIDPPQPLNQNILIDKDSARLYHTNYCDTKPGRRSPIGLPVTPQHDDDVTRAVYYKMSELVSLWINGGVQVPYQSVGFFTYLSNYGQNFSDSDKKNHSSTIVHMATKQPGEKPQVLDETQIYNLGDLCPPNCPKNEIIQDLRSPVTPETPLGSNINM